MQSELWKRSHWMNMSWAPGPGPYAPGQMRILDSHLPGARWVGPEKAGASSSVLLVVVVFCVEFWECPVVTASPGEALSPLGFHCPGFAGCDHRPTWGLAVTHKHGLSHKPLGGCVLYGKRAQTPQAPKTGYYNPVGAPRDSTASLTARVAS